MQLTPINKHFNACDQQWDDMPEKGNGRHCQQCDRVLVDLTDKTEQQVLELQMQHNFKLCGRYTVDQVHRLDRYLTLQEQPKRSHMPWLVKLAMGLSASGAPLLAAAQEPLPGEWIEQAQPSDTLIDIYPGYHSPWVRRRLDFSGIVTGSVIDTTEKQGVPFSIVSLVDDNDSVISKVVCDLDGGFKIDLSNNDVQVFDRSRISCIQVESLGYGSVCYPVNDIELDTNGNLQFELELLSVIDKPKMKEKIVGNMVLEIQVIQNIQYYDIFNSNFRWVW